MLVRRATLEKTSQTRNYLQLELNEETKEERKKTGTVGFTAKKTILQQPRPPMCISTPYS